MFKTLDATLIIALAATLLFGWGWQGHQNAREQAQKVTVVQGQLDRSAEALRAANRAAEVREAALLERAIVAEKQRVTTVAQQRKLNEAAKANPVWAAQPVPDSVWDALQANPGDGVPADGSPSEPAAALPNR